MAGKVYVESYGCSLNHADTALMKTVLARKGYTFTADPWEADVLLINTCTVRLDSEQRMRKRIRELDVIASRTGARLVVAGCMAAAQPFTVKRLSRRAVLLTPENAHRVVEAVENGWDIVDEPSKPKTLYTPDERIAVKGRVAEVPIVDGCLGNCSFCITKLARRKVLSRPLEKILGYIERLVRRGVVEIRLTGQDTAVYGVDLYGKRALPELLERIAGLEGEFMVRVGMMSPDQATIILDELLEAFRSSKLYKFFHLPVQSGDNGVLKIMNRRYTVDEYRALVQEIRRKVPGATIATDIIVGHPGEDEEAFENTLRLVEELRFERVHVAQYTPRPRTLAAGLPQVPDPVKKDRSKRLMAVVERIGFEEHRRYVGSRVQALLVSPGERGGVEARLYNYTQVILPETWVGLGKWRTVEILEATWYDLRGALLDDHSGQGERSREALLYTGGEQCLSPSA